MVVAASTGGGTAMHCGREGRLQTGSAALLRPDVPFRLDVTAGTQLVYMVVPAIDLLEREPRLNNIAGRTLTGMVAALSHEALSTAREGTPCIGLLDRLALSLGAEIDKQPDGAFGAGELFRQAMAVIVTRSSEPDLRALDVAQQLGVTVRQLESMFRRRHSSMLEATMTVRISAAEAMVKAAAANVDLEGVARATGFYDQSHLQRCWHKINGTPLQTSRADADAAQGAAA